MPVHAFTSADTLVLWWMDAPTASDVEQAVRLLREMGEVRGRRPHYICIVSSHARPPDASGRAAFVERVDEVMSLCEHFHLVLEGNPFLNAVARGLIATASFLSRYRERVTVHPALEAAVAAVPPSRGGGVALSERVRNQRPRASVPPPT